ncbi:GGDEF domain-containing protein [Comamonas flocculans]|uniref:diguanylate cyclase n=1 Tax=Comamonas flocculans TaxID=2597701 RepID=A0A5B8RTC6_9BURK|nr:GGDEF domain-containing protein [Comamonas flocculans]QEA12741.1 GGDEF domain-containing protein [Comamonas flocculans]
MNLPFRFDTPSMLVMIIVATAAMALAIAVVRPARREGLGLWALALVAHALAYVLLLTHALLPDGLGLALSNASLSLALALLLGAVHGFHARPLPRMPVALPVLTVFLLAAWFAQDYRARILVTSAVWSLQITLVVHALWRPQRPAQSRGAWLLSGALGVQALLLVARGLWFVGHTPPGAGFLQGGDFDALALICSHAVLVLASLGFILLTKDRADAVNLHLASNDPLTEIPNRRQLRRTLARDVARAVRERQPYALLLVDVDHFKAVNDRFGHAGGDMALRHVAHLLQQPLRQQDLVGRWGGENFLVLLPATTATGAQLVAEKLRQLVERTPGAHLGHSIALTVSIGRCAEVLEPGDEPEHLVETADKALYAAKRAGRNRVESASLPRMHLLRGAQAAPSRHAS